MREPTTWRRDALVPLVLVPVAELLVLAALVQSSGAVAALLVGAMAALAAAAVGLLRLARVTGPAAEPVVEVDVVEPDEPPVEPIPEPPVALAHDRLTGLIVRDVFLRQAAAVMSVAGPAAPVGLLVCNLDGFSAVNDVYGRAAGDEVLRAVAARLRRSLRPQELVGRTGGDEFSVVLPGPVDDAAVAHIAERLQSAVAPAIPLHGGNSVRIGMRIARMLLDRPVADVAGLLPARVG